MRTPPNERLTSDIAERPTRGKPDNASRSERRCLLSGESRPREELVRLALSPTGEVLPDPGAKAPGRGAWIAPDRSALEAAVADGHLKRALMRAFKGGPEGVTLSWPDDLPQRIEDALARNLCDRLGLELRGGNVVLGSARIEEQARTGRIALLLHASDSSEDGRKRLDQAWRVGMEREGSGARGTVLPLDRAALSVAVGRDNVVHLGVSDAKGSQASTANASERIGRAVSRLSRFTGSDP
ncbi:MAG: DUF448 domain-containing protein [Erythrobacter sp.]